MNNSKRTFIASAVTLAAIGGLAVAGTHYRSDSGQPAAAAVQVKPKVIHKRRVKKVNVPASGSSGGGSPVGYSSGYSGGSYGGSSSSAPAVVPATQPKPAVVTQPSPTGGSGDNEGESESEPEHESGD